MVIAKYIITSIVATVGLVLFHSKQPPSACKSKLTIESLDTHGKCKTLRIVISPKLRMRAVASVANKTTRQLARWAIRVLEGLLGRDDSIRVG